MLLNIAMNLSPPPSLEIRPTPRAKEMKYFILIALHPSS
jgi:hypothetical protein